MEQHPIPQQISSYEFKLVGEMTLKQFLKAAGGILLAVLINSTKIVAIIKWPLMLFSGGLGLLLAFVPFEDRPLETWITAFIKSIYSPTIFLYKKKNDNSWLEFKAGQVDGDEPEEAVESKNLFVSVIKDTNLAKEKFIREKFRLGRKNKRLGEGTEKDVVEEAAVTVSKTMEPTTTEEALTQSVKTEEIKTTDWRDEKANLNLKTEKLGATGRAVFGSIPMPDRPDTANVIVGMATTPEGKIIDGVIVEIQDDHGNPARVIKTNLLGQFKISTPLSNGRYLIIAEKEGYEFDRVNVDLTGEIVDPIRIIANN
jgi:hypothetical protein